MKKLLLTLSALAIVASNINAQDLSTERVSKKLSKFRFGLFVAPGSAWLKPATSTSSESGFNYDITKGKGKTAFAFGLNAEKPLTEKYFLVSGITLDWQGGNVKATKAASSTGTDTAYATSADMSYKLQYLQIPLGLKLNATHINKFQIYGQIGLDASIMIGRKGTYAITNPALSGTNVKLGGTTMIPFGLGMQFGIGTEFKVSEDNSAYATILYRNGFTDVTNPLGRSAADRKWSDGNVRANNISLRIGYYF